MASWSHRRRNLHSDGPEQFIFQPLVNSRTLEFAMPLLTTQDWQIVRSGETFQGRESLNANSVARCF